jgi:hypothetical protein
MATTAKEDENAGANLIGRQPAGKALRGRKDLASTATNGSTKVSFLDVLSGHISFPQSDAHDAFLGYLYFKSFRCIHNQYPQEDFG